MHRRFLKSVSMLMAGVLLLTAPVFALDAEDIIWNVETPGIRTDTSSDGAIITLGIFIGVCVLLVLVGLKADYENVFGQKQEFKLNVDEETFANRISVVLERPEFRDDGFGADAQDEADLAENLGLGLRFEF